MRTRRSFASTAQVSKVPRYPTRWRWPPPAITQPADLSCYHSHHQHHRLLKPCSPLLPHLEQGLFKMSDSWAAMIMPRNYNQVSFV